MNWSLHSDQMRERKYVLYLLSVLGASRPGGSPLILQNWLRSSSLFTRCSRRHGTGRGDPETPSFGLLKSRQGEKVFWRKRSLVDTRKFCLWPIYNANHDLLSSLSQNCEFSVVNGLLRIREVNVHYSPRGTRTPPFGQLKDISSLYSKPNSWSFHQNQVLRQSFLLADWNFFLLVAQARSLGVICLSPFGLL